MNFKATRLALLSLFVLSLTFSSCDPLRPILMILEGDWDVTSFTEDGVEVMGTVFTSIQIEFEEYGETEGVVHARSSFESGERDCDGLRCFFQGVVVGRDEFAGVAGEGSEDKADVEVGEAGASTEF